MDKLFFIKKTQISTLNKRCQVFLKKKQINHYFIEKRIGAHQKKKKSQVLINFKKIKNKVIFDEQFEEGYRAAFKVKV